LGGIVLVIGELTKNFPHKITISCMILKYITIILQVNRYCNDIEVVLGGNWVNCPAQREIPKEINS